MKITLPVVVVLAGAVELNEASRANPIRKVVTMLQNLQKKVQAEAEKEEQLFKKYMCYCKSAGGDLQDSIAQAGNKIPQLESEIEAATAAKTQLEEDLAKHRADRTAAKEAMAKATGIREKEAAAFAAMKEEFGTNIDAMERAVAALEKGMGGAFLQSKGASVVRKAIKLDQNMDDDDRSVVAAFLDATSSEQYSPQSGQIVGILKQSLDEMAKGLADATATENDAINAFSELIAAKKKEVAACTKAIEEKTVRVGETAVSIAQMKADLGDTADSLAEDKKFLEDMDANCAKKSKEWDTIVKNRAEEEVALADTIKILNDDDALELFKKALPAPGSSFVQLQESVRANKARATSMLSGYKNLEFISLALNGKKVGLEKVIAMVDEMVALLKQEQEDDDSKKEYCATQADSLDDKKKGLERTVSNAAKAIADAKAGLDTLAGEIAALTKGIKTLDESVAEATANRKEENADFTALMAQDTAAKQLLGLAKNRLNKFYNPKLAKFMQVGAAPPPPPEAPGDYKKKSEAGNSIIAMLDELAADLDKEMTVAKAEEKDAQAAYERSMTDAKEKRAQDSKTISDKKGIVADTEAALQTATGDKTSAGEELKATLTAIEALHGECDWILKYYDLRKESRAGEIDALGKAKAVLNGADFSLLQMQQKRLRGAPDYGKMEIIGKEGGYRNAWDDCGGIGASATMRMQTIAAKIKGWSKPRKFIRNAAQDAGSVHPSGMKPGPGEQITYPAAGVWTAAREGLAKASATLAKYK